MQPTPDAAVLVAAGGGRAFGDGFASVLLPVYLVSLRLAGFQIGGRNRRPGWDSPTHRVCWTWAHRLQMRRLLVRAALLIAATGPSFALLSLSSALSQSEPRTSSIPDRAIG